MRYRTLAFLLSAELISACSCELLTECQIATRPVIFIAKVVQGGVESIRQDPWLKVPKTVRLEVIETFRGLPVDTKFVDMEISLWAGMCRPSPYRQGRTYLVMPRTIRGKFTDGGCFTGRDVESESDTIDYLRRHFRNRAQSHIRGKATSVPRNVESGLIDFLLDRGDARILAGVKVWTTLRGQVFSATTDAHGRYELEVPEPGSYSVQADLSPYQSAITSVAIPGAGACAVNHIGLLSGSSIVGKVRDRKGSSLRHAMVGLIDFDNPSGKEAGQIWFRTAYGEEPDGSFHFANVPLGRYLLAFNPDGPQIAGYEPFPLESTFHANGIAVAQAQVIEVDRAGMRLEGKDLIAGPPVAFRSVIVKVRFADGAPMTTAHVGIIGEPLEPGGIPWRGGRHMEGTTKEVQIQAPTNRKLRITIKDNERRELKNVYESIHAPGATPILQEFIIADQ